MSNLTFKKIEDTVNDYDLYLFDMWGVVIEGSGAYEGVVDKLNDLSEKKKVLFVTNAPRPNYIIAQNLTNWGFKNITTEEVITSGDIAREFIKDNWTILNKTPNIFHLGGDKNKDLLHNIQHNLVHDIEQANILLISAFRDEGQNIKEFDELLIKAANNKDITTICANPDTLIPNNGKIKYCPGYFAGIVEKHGGEVIYTGKPKKSIYTGILEKYSNIKLNRILMIGDTFDTDILGAQDSGINSALVLTGNCHKFHKDYDDMEDKLKTLDSYSKKLGMIPTFVTSIT